MDPFAPPTNPTMPPMMGGATPIPGPAGALPPMPGETGALDPSSLTGLGGPFQPSAPITLEDQGNGVFGVNPEAQMGGNMGQDAVLAEMLAQVDLQAPVEPTAPIVNRRNRPPKPDEGFCEEIVQRDKQEAGLLLDRFARDLSIYRQHESGTPKDFNTQRDPQFISAAMSNLVNKLASMMAGVDVTYEVDYGDLETERAAQAMEDFAHLMRKYERRFYAVDGGGNLQRDEFWYLLLHGRLVYRVLPDFDDSDYPFNVTMLDPATCYPYFGGGKQGLIRLTREYNLRLGEVVEAYANNSPKTRREIINRLGYNEESYRENYHLTGVAREYWDKNYRYVSWGGQAVLPVTYHGLGVVPFIYVTAFGEPKNVHTPNGRYMHLQDEYGHIGYGVSRDMDVVEKGVSVFHYLVNTNRIQEALHTLLLIEVYKASNPATVTYSAPHLMGSDIPPLDTGIGGNNHRILGLQKVEGLPTSPRPTDVSPVMGKLEGDFFNGSLPPGASGNQPGSNISGFAIQSLLSAAKDIAIPYTQAWELAQELKLEMMATFYRDMIAPVSPLTVGHKVNYGAAYDREFLTPDIIKLAGTMITVKLSGISDQELPQRAAAIGQMMQIGMISQRKAMEMMEIRKPDQMFNEILAEKALQHPMMQEIIAIPEALIDQGYPKEFVEAWMTMVVGPKLPQIGMPGPGGGGGGAMGGGDPMAQLTGGGGAGAPVPPDQGLNPSSPGGPAPGEGRGPAPV